MNSEGDIQCGTCLATFRYIGHITNIREVSCTNETRSLSSLVGCTNFTIECVCDLYRQIVLGEKHEYMSLTCVAH